MNPADKILEELPNIIEQAILDMKKYCPKCTYKKQCDSQGRDGYKYAWCPINKKEII